MKSSAFIKFLRCIKYIYIYILCVFNVTLDIDRGVSYEGRNGLILLNLPYYFFFSRPYSTRSRGEKMKWHTLWNFVVVNFFPLRDWIIAAVPCNVRAYFTTYDLIRKIGNFDILSRSSLWYRNIKYIFGTSPRTTRDNTPTHRLCCSIKIKILFRRVFDTL